MKRGTRLISERLKRIRIENELSDQKKKLLTEMFYRRKTAMSWNFSEIGQIKPEVYLPMKIRIISHKTWQIPEFQIPRFLNDTVAEMIKKRLRNEILKLCFDSYRNS